MLCDPCTNVLSEPKFSRFSALDAFNSRPSQGFQTHHSDYESLQVGLRTKCGICHRLAYHQQAAVVKISGILADGGELVPDVEPSTFSTKCRLAIETASRKVISFFVLIEAKKSGKPVKQLCKLFFFHAAEQAPLQFALDPSPQNGVESTSFEVLTKWIQDCRDNHVACRREGAPIRRRQFARIVDVGLDRDSTSVKLCNSTELPDEADYVTLSHCWGTAKVPILTKANHSEYSQEISLELLPQTFKDAIQLTRQLDIRYIWIDSLCIIQDCGEDWLEQAAIMGDVYHASYLNIAATNAQDSTGSLFVERNPILIKPLRLHISLPEGQGPAGYFDVDSSHTGKWLPNITRSKLCNRGWVVQERLLAPRVVHFAKTQLFWECVHSRTCEEHPQTKIEAELDGTDSSRTSFKAWDPFSDKLIESPPRRPLQLNYVWSSIKALQDRETLKFQKAELTGQVELFSRAKLLCFGETDWTTTHPLISYWSNLIQLYSGTKLTRIGDRMIAIAGLAKIISEQTGVRYVAGHWLHQLPRQLLWFYLQVEPDQEIAAYIAPSWSWASATGSLGLRGTRLDPLLESNGAMDLVKVVSVEVEGLGSEEPPFSGLKAAKLRMRGRLLPLTIDLTLWPKGVSRKDTLVQYWQGSTAIAPIGETFLVPILFTRWNEKLPGNTSNSLILESTGERGVFRRVGIARLSSLCSLREVTPQLYAARSAYHEDSDDDATSDGEIDPTLQDFDASLVVKEPSPQQELMEKRRSVIQSPKMQKALGQAQEKIDQVMSKSQNKAAGTLKRIISVAQTASQMSPGQRQPTMSKAQVEDMVANVQQGLAEQQTFSGTVAVSARKNMWIPRPVLKLPPKDAVAPHFYMEYIDDDEDVVRFGHFVFDII